jgi:hypothetical protein
MTIIRFSGFGGENRALHPMLLPETVGVTSTNQKPGRGDLRPWAAPLNKATVPAGRKTIYRMGRDTPRDDTYWLSWTTEVHVVCAPNATDTAERTYFSGGAAFAPRWTDNILATASAPFPTAYRTLGVPAPSSVCLLAAASPGAVVAPLLVADSQYVITTVGTTNWLTIGAENELVSSGSFVVGTAYTIKTVGGTDYTLIGASASTIGVSFTASGVGTGSGTATKNDMAGVIFTASGAGSGTGTATLSNTLPETRIYTYTCVTDIGEESAPCPPSTELVCKTLDGVTISNLTAPSGTYGINRFRIYRTQKSSSGGDFYFLREIASTLTSTTDDGRKLGEILPTTTWLPAPGNVIGGSATTVEPSLSWLTGLWNGMMAGISGRSVRICEAYTYYAWPKGIGYEILPTNAQPVALATFGQTLVMLTNGNPSIITGGTPDAMDEQPVEFYQSCVAPLSAVGMGHGVAWASPDGLAYIGSGGPRMLTEGMLTRDDWQAIVPSSIQGTMYERRYLATYTVAGVKKGFVLDPANSSGMYFLDFGFDALYLDDLQDALFVLDGVNIQKWDASTTLKTVTAKSKLFRMPKPMQAFSCAEVVADTYPVTFKIYADGALKHTQTVASAEPFRLPGGYYAQTFQLEVIGTSAIQGMAAAHSMKEMAAT